MSSFKHNTKSISPMPRYYQSNPQYRRQLLTTQPNRMPIQPVIRQSMESLVDFATTACNRPPILEQTYASLAKRIKGIRLSECRLFLNIDPMPDGENMEDNVRVAEKYFGEVIVNMTEKGSFPRAFRWCMNQIQKPYCFYVQDDWEFMQDFNIRTLISTVNKNSQIASINLYKTDGGSSNSNRIYLSPSLFKTKHFKKINNMLLLDYSPEKQLRPMHPTKNPYPYGGRILRILKYYGLCYRKNMYPMVIDLGRSWMKTQGLQKSKGIFGNFQSWSTTGRGLLATKAVLDKHKQKHQSVEIIYTKIKSEDEEINEDDLEIEIEIDDEDLRFKESMFSTE